MPDSLVLDPEDAKLVTLARATRARVGAAEGAAVRDGTGRTYAAVSVALHSLQLSALQAAVVMAVASGATVLEAAAVVGEAPTLDQPSLATLRDLGGPGVPVHLVGPDGGLVGEVRT